MACAEKVQYGYVSPRFPCSDLLRCNVAPEARHPEPFPDKNPYVNTAKTVLPHTHNPRPFSTPKLTKVSVAGLALFYAMQSAGNLPKTIPTAISGLDEFVML
jgi:hypothetical protein